MFFMIFGFGLQYVTKNIVPGVNLKKNYVLNSSMHAHTCEKVHFLQKNAKKNAF